MKKFNPLFIFAFAALCLGFASCGDDKKEDNGGGKSEISADRLVGTWKSVWEEGWYKNSASPEENDEWSGVVSEEDSETITFREDFTGGENPDEVFTWSLNGNRLISSDM